MLGFILIRHNREWERRKETKEREKGEERKGEGETIFKGYWRDVEVAKGVAKAVGLRLIKIGASILISFFILILLGKVSNFIADFLIIFLFF